MLSGPPHTHYTCYWGVKATIWGAEAITKNVINIMYWLGPLVSADCEPARCLMVAGPLYLSPSER